MSSFYSTPCWRLWINSNNLLSNVNIFEPWSWCWQTNKSTSYCLQYSHTSGTGNIIPVTAHREPNVCKLIASSSPWWNAFTSMASFVSFCGLIQILNTNSYNTLIGDVSWLPLLGFDEGRIFDLDCGAARWPGIVFGRIPLELSLAIYWIISYYSNLKHE